MRHALSLLVWIPLVGACGAGLYSLGGGETGGGSSDVPHGAADPTYFGVGWVQRTFTLPAPYVGNPAALIASAEGFLVTVAALDTLGLETDHAVFKITPDGTIDSSFGNNGLTVTSAASGGIGSETPSRNLFAGGGKVLSVGFASGVNILFARTTSSGAPDTTFDTDGIFVHTLGGSSWQGMGVTIDGQGRALTCGVLDSDAYISRILSNGGADTSLDGDGLVTTDIGGGFEQYSTIITQTDGKVVAVGYDGVGGSTSNMLVARYSSTGVLDATFATAGVFTLDFEGQADSLASVALQSDGKILAVGYKTSASGTDTDFAVLRFLTSGSLDSTYSSDGRVVLDFGYTSESAGAVSLDSLGRAVVAGTASSRIAIFRLNTDGSLDSDFGTNGLQRHTEPAIFTSMAITSDGKILTTGLFSGVAKLFRNLP